MGVAYADGGGAQSDFAGRLHEKLETCWRGVCTADNEADRHLPVSIHHCALLDARCVDKPLAKFSRLGQMVWQRRNHGEASSWLTAYIMPANAKDPVHAFALRESTNYDGLLCQRFVRISRSQD